MEKVSIKILNHLTASIKKEPDNLGVYVDLFSYLRGIEKSDFELTHKKNSQLRQSLVKAMRKKEIVREYVPEFFELYKKTLLFDAPHYFDPFLQYLEIKRPPQERFYLPRRNVLRPLVQGLQDLADDKLDELFLSEPPRVGKTTTLLFYGTWLMGRNSEGSILYSAYSDTITRAYYQGVLEVLNDPDTYLWQDVFPESKIVQTNAQEETINLDRKKRYPSLTARSLYGTLNGACDCNYCLIADDLIGGIEEALNPDRLMAAWSKVDNNLIPRAKEGAKLLWCGTRWSINDPAGVRMDLLENDQRFKDRRYRIINLPALNEKDRSNFNYQYGVGFTTEYYRQRRASFERNGDIASWQAQYMGEPIEREGTVFNPSDLRYFDDIPTEEPDRVVLVLDPSFGGKDYTAGPICYIYGDDIYIVDVVYTNEDKVASHKNIVAKIERYGVTAVQIEANKSTEGYKDGIRELLAEKGIRINLTTKPAPPNKAKEDRILASAPYIREFMLFREVRDREYSQFMQNLFSFKLLGKNKHDDAPDSLSMAIDMIMGRKQKAEPFKRFF